MFGMYSMSATYSSREQAFISNSQRHVLRTTGPNNYLLAGIIPDANGAFLSARGNVLAEAQGKNQRFQRRQPTGSEIIMVRSKPSKVKRCCVALDGTIRPGCPTHRHYNLV